MDTGPDKQETHNQRRIENKDEDVETTVMRMMVATIKRSTKMNMMMMVMIMMVATNKKYKDEHTEKT